MMKFSSGSKKTYLVIIIFKFFILPQFLKLAGYFSKTNFSTKYLLFWYSQSWNEAGYILFSHLMIKHLKFMKTFSEKYHLVKLSIIMKLILKINIYIYEILNIIDIYLKTEFKYSIDLKLLCFIRCFFRELLGSHCF